MSGPSNMQVPVKKLVLCFDGTGNQFTGSSGDTNIIKLFNKFDRDDPHQYHYYQTGIGTYDIGGGSINKGWIGGIRSSITRTLDSGFGTSFDHHVMAGYKFLMNHYNQGDKIYMFGFSRGAFTARFLSRMIHSVGLLSMGNEEMVPFAYELYQRYEQGQFEYPSAEEVRNALAASKDAATKGINIAGNAAWEAGNAAREQLGKIDVGKIDVRSLPSFLSAGSSTTDLSTTSAETDITVPAEAEAEAPHYAAVVNHAATQPVVNEADITVPTVAAPKPIDAKTQQVVNEMTAFKATFCRKVKVHFLGIFDCVNSVSVLGNPKEPRTVLGTADHVRHAVAVDEFRVKFKPALLHQDVGAYETATEDRKEVWFPGNHGDVGGGWPIVPEASGFWSTLKRWWSGDTQEIGTSADPSHDSFQLSDMPLDWMIRELELVNAANPEEWAISFSKNKDEFKNLLRQEDKLKQAKEGRIHDTMSASGGNNLLKALLWNFMEYIPFIGRYELERGKWVLRYWPPNLASPRDIPKNSIIHQSLVDRISNAALAYRPQNNYGDTSAPCLLDKDGKSVARFAQVHENVDGKVDIKLATDELHRVWKFVDVGSGHGD